MVKFKNFLRKAQGMTEYIIIVLMIAVAAIIVVKLFGKQLRQLFTKASESIGSGQVQTPSKVAPEGKLDTYYEGKSGGGR